MKKYLITGLNVSLIVLCCLMDKTTNAQTWNTAGNSSIGSGFLGTTDNNSLLFKTNNSERMRIEAGGDVAIGTTSAGGYRLRIAGGHMLLDNNKSLYIKDAAGNDINAIGIDNSSYTVINASYNGGGGATIFKIGGNEKMRLLNNGYVGIGTISPRSPLEVRVAGNNSTIQTALIIQQTNPGVPNNSAGVSLDFGIGNNGTNNYIQGKIAVKETYWGVNPKMIFSLWDAGYTMQDRMTIDYTGNVGIGTTAPSSILHTVASGAKTAAYSGNLLANTATSSTASIRKAGLEITSTGTWNGSSASNVGLYVSSVTGGTNNYDAIFNGGGNVGIGTTTPFAKLEVAQTEPAGSSARAARFSNGTNRLFVIPKMGGEGYFNW